LIAWMTSCSSSGRLWLFSFELSAFPFNLYPHVKAP